MSEDEMDNEEICGILELYESDWNTLRRLAGFSLSSAKRWLWELICRGLALECVVSCEDEECSIPDEHDWTIGGFSIGTMLAREFLDMFHWSNLIDGKQEDDSDSPLRFERIVEDGVWYGSKWTLNSKESGDDMAEEL